MSKDKTMATLIEFARRAERIMGEKGSYEPIGKTDPRVTVEYERAYALIQDLAGYAPAKGRVIQGEAVTDQLRLHADIPESQR